MTSQYVELHANSAFSFLQAASSPESLVEHAIGLEMPAMALLDQCTHISMWYGPGGVLSEEQMAKLYAEMALRSVGAKPQ